MEIKKFLRSNGFHALGAILCIGKAFGLADIAWWQATMPFWLVPAILLVCAFGGFLVWAAAETAICMLDLMTKHNQRKITAMRIKRDAARRARMN